MKIPRHLKYGTLEEFEAATGIGPDELMHYEKSRLAALDTQYEKYRQKWRDDEIENDMVGGYPVSQILVAIDKSREKCKEKIRSYEIEMMQR